MGLRGFRAHISLKKKESKTPPAPEFYRKISQFDSDASYSQNNGTPNLVQIRTVAIVNDTVPQRNSSAVKYDYSRNENADQSSTQITRDPDQLKSTSERNVQFADVIIETHAAKQMALVPEAQMDMRKDMPSKSNEDVHIEPIEVAKNEKLEENEMEI